MLMEMCTMEIGRLIRHVGMGYLWISTMPSMKGTGWMTSNMEKALKHGENLEERKQSILEGSSRERKMEREDSNGKMALIMKETL
jgi:hypothetical protein